MSMPGQGWSSARPYPPTATRAQPGSAAQWRLHASRSTVSTSAAREWTSSSTGSEARKRALGSSWAERRSSRHAAGSRSAASRAGRVSSSGQEIGGGVAGRVAAGGSESQAPMCGRLVIRAVRGQSEHLAPRPGHEHRVLPLGGERVVLGDDGPAVGEQAHVALAGVHHRLDGEGHAGLELESRTGLAIVQHLRVLVIDAPDAVTAVLAHHRIVVPLDEALNGVAYVAEARPGPHRLDAAPHGREARFGEALRVRRRLAHEVHAAGVPVEAVADPRYVDIDETAGLQ